MSRLRPFLFLLIISSRLFAQESNDRSIHITVIDGQRKPLAGASVFLVNSDSTIKKSVAANISGLAEFRDLAKGKYRIRATQAGHEDGFTLLIDLENNRSFTDSLILRPRVAVLNDVTVVSKKPLIQFLPDKTVINPEADITNAGATLMDVLEKAPGITVGKDGSIIMKGKPAVTVLMDGKLTQLSGADLQSYLSGISASQIDQIELIENPGAKYDASGNAGIINIRTKATRIKGFNGSMNLSVGQGFYPKTGNSINLNYRNGKVNWFMNYGMRAATEKINLWSLRTYLDQNEQDSLLLEQPNFSRNTVLAHNLKTGFDFFVSNKTTLGLTFTGGTFDRNARSFSKIDWMDPHRNLDSSINTWGQNIREFRRGGVNFNVKHKIDDKTELNADLDYVRFSINADQNYQTQLLGAGNETFSTMGIFPSKLNILTGKIDYSKRFKLFLLEAGLKTAINKTDNLTDFYYSDNNNWVPDLGRSNHFLYNENISALYASVDAEQGKWHWQAGLRYEITAYKAHQLGNAVVKDSSFKRNYGSLFPSAFVSYEADSNHLFTFRLGRRIDRPAFQHLNPYITTLNKYTFEAGNPFINPQYTWNFALAHTYKQMLTTEFSYSYLRDYFSQIFIIDSNSSNVNKNVIIYTRGNVGSFQNFGITETFQYPVAKWWNLTAVAVFNYKIIKGVVWEPIKAEVAQLNVSINNQFQLKKGWGFEVSGYYQTNSQIDLQETLTPQGELNFGISKQILKNKGSLKLSVRDLTYYQNYSGYSTFENSREPFTVKWDSRVIRLNFSWRFGKPMKPINRSEGGASEEINRVGGN